jgi:poly(glycerol-phosphate) alpha-glucosyltransferase
MRHLHIIQTLDISRSGGLVGVASLHRAMLEIGIPSRLAYVKTEKAVDIPPESVALETVRGNRFHFGWDCSRQLGEEIERADIVHVHGLYTYLNYVAGKWSRRGRKALIYHPHGTLAPAYLRRSRLKKALVLAAFERKNFRSLTAWRALSPVEAEQIAAYVPRAPVFVVSNGVFLPADLEAKDRPARLAVATEGGGPKRIFLFLSRVAFVKGLDLLFEAWLATARQRNEVELWIAGPDFDGTADYLTRKIAEHGIENVRLLGAVSEQEKDWLLRRADVFVLPSRGEGQSSAILEAMAYATPVLLTTKCYFPAAAKSAAGVECTDTVEGLTEALKRLLAMPEADLEIMGKNARTLIASGFDIREKVREIDAKTTSFVKGSA